jgi:hypothetical protein
MRKPAGALVIAALWLLAACGGNGRTAAPQPAAPVLPAPRLDGWKLPALPGTTPPVPADPASVLARLRQYAAPLPATARGTSVIVATLPDANVSVHGVYPQPGYCDCKVSAPFDAQSTGELEISGSLDLHNPLSRLGGRFVEVGLVTNASYQYAMDPDGNPQTDDANPAYLFNQNVLLLCAQDQAGHAFAAPLDYNNSAGIGPAQTIPGNFIRFKLRLHPGAATGGTAAVAFNGGAYGPEQAYGANNWGWWPAESFHQARLIVQVYSYNPDPLPFKVDFYDIKADNPNYVPPSWHVVTVDTEPTDAMAPSLAIVNGKPAISFSGLTGSSAYFFVRANDANGTNWGTPLAVSPRGNDGASNQALAVVNGRPAVVCNAEGGRLVYVRADDADGASWGTPSNVDLGGFMPRLAVVDGKPACVYMYFSYELKFARAKDSDGLEWEAPVVAVPEAGAQTESFAVINGLPSISFSNRSYSELFFTRAVDVAGSTWIPPVSIGPGTGQSSLAEVDGRPAVAFRGAGSQYPPSFVRALDSRGDAWGAPQTFDNLGGGICLAVVNGVPALSYFVQNGQNMVRYVEAEDIDGDNWPAPVTVGTMYGWNRQTSMVTLDSGNPAFAYNEYSNFILKYAAYY